MSVLLQSGNARLEFFEQLPRAAQHRDLHVEFLARDQIELHQARLQDGAEVFLEIALQTEHAGGHGTRKALSEVIQHFRIDHDSSMLAGAGQVPNASNLCSPS